MDINELLKGRKNCGCTKDHKCEIEHVRIGSGVINELPQLSRKYKNILIAADNNTYRVCGSRVAKLPLSVMTRISRLEKALQKRSTP